MNKRPLTPVLAGFVLGEVWIWQFGGTAALAALCFGAIICCIIGYRKKGSFFVLILFSAGLVAGSMRQFQWNQTKEQYDRYKKEESLIISGQILEIRKKTNTFSFLMDSICIENSEIEGSLLLYLDNEMLCPIGTRLSLKGRIEDFALPSNPGEFHQKKYQEGKGVFGVIYDAEILKIEYGSFMIKDGIYNIREKIAEYLRSHMKEELSGIAIAMILGDKGNLLEEQKQLYEIGGISHILAVSGLHMSLIGAGIYKMFRKIGVGYNISVLCSFPCIIIYAVMTGMSSSSLRAAMMLMIYLIAEMKGYYYDLPSALSVAAILLLLDIPARLFDSGFLLSFSAMISVGILCPFLFEIFEYNVGEKRIRAGLLSGLLIIVFTLPVSLYFFYGISLAGILLNLIVIPLMACLVPILFAGGFGWIPFIPDYIAVLFLKMAECILLFYNALCSLVDNVSFSYYQAGCRNVFFAIGYYIILTGMIVFLFFLRKKGRILKSIYCISSTLIIMLFVWVTGYHGSFMTMLDVGQGDGIIYHNKDGIICMMDGGSTSKKNVGRYIMKPALEYYGIKNVDYWFLSHMDEDHISGVIELLETNYPVQYIVLPYRIKKTEKQLELERLAYENNTELLYMKQGDRIELGEDSFLCLYPQKDQKREDENQNSLVLLLETKNVYILLTGDIEKEGEADMNDYLKRINLKKDKKRVLKTAHHGSANGTSRTFLDQFLPDSAIISCSKENRYGHPAKVTIERLTAVGTDLYYTMEYGAIEIRFGKETSYLGYGMIK